MPSELVAWRPETVAYTKSPPNIPGREEIWDSGQKQRLFWIRLSDTVAFLALPSAATEIFPRISEQELKIEKKIGLAIRGSHF
jgi:hypothetical protein